VVNIDIRLPNITGKSETEQLSQIKSYLYQFASQLQWALETVSTENSSNVVNQKASGSAASSTKDDPAATFSELKGLIIKSADIVNAYYEKIDALLKLSGYYTASSEFGTFKEETLNQLSATNDKIIQNVESLQTIFDENGNIKAELLVNGHIYSGIIEYAKDGEAIVGIEIGQTTTENGEKTFTSFARFTANKLSFYDASSVEVAYISNFKMVITEAWVKGNLELGTNGKEDGPSFILDTSNGIALRPV
jgi:hypothetical protein